jgi:hypothetical protein
VLLACWDIERHRRRIESCEGVREIMRLPVSGKAVELDDEVDLIQAAEAGVLIASLPRHKRRRINPEIPPGDLRISTRSNLAGLTRLDSERRTRQFENAMGLGDGSSTAPRALGRSGKTT